jgi:hypothetical protein
MRRTLLRSLRLKGTFPIGTMDHLVLSYSLPDRFFR